MEAQETGELARLRTERLDLLQQVDELNRRLRENAICIANFAPVNTIPDEVLMLIFEEAYCHAHPDHSAPVLCNSESLTAVTQVSRRWRNVAIALPSLWTCIHDSLSDYNIELFSTRSLTLPLQFVSQATTRPPTDLIPILRRDAPRWTHVHFGGKDGQAGFAFMDTLRMVELPALEYLAFYNVDRYTLGSEWSVNTGFDGPFWGNLQHLVMNGALLDWRLSQSSTLQTLHIGALGLSGHQLNDLSRAFPNLAELAFNNFVLHGGLGDQPPVIRFPSLRTITLSLTSWRELTCFIDAPRLRSITSKQEPICIDAIDLSVHSPKIYPSLTHISLTHCLMASELPFPWRHSETDTTFQLFRQSPNLKSLDILDCRLHTMHRFFTWLRDTITDGGHVLLPVLESVAITDIQADWIGIVEEFCRRRSMHHPPLRELKLGQRAIEIFGEERLRVLSQLVTIIVMPVTVSKPVIY